LKVVESARTIFILNFLRCGNRARIENQTPLSASLETKIHSVPIPITGLEIPPRDTSPQNIQNSREIMKMADLGRPSFPDILPLNHWQNLFLKKLWGHRE